VRYSHITLSWLAFLGALVAVALFDPSVASGIARLSLLAVAVLGFGLVVYLSVHGYDRAVLLIPTWLLLVVWVVAAGFAVTGSLTNDIVGPALLGGLVLIVMLIGFTVMQHAFAGGITHGIVTDVERRALALTGSGDMIWIGTSPPTRCSPARKPSSCWGSSAARSKARRRAGSRSFIRSIAIAFAPPSTACWSSGAAGSPRTSACAPRTATISGLP